MSKKKSVHLSLLDNSHAFLDEAVQKAIAAQADVRQWQFAIFHVVQSLELSLKSLLHEIHPILVYDNIDAPRHTVNLSKAIGRLQDQRVGDLVLTETERQKIEKAIDLRNQVVHSEFELKPEYAAAKFFEVFAFVVYFQASRLKCEVEDVLSEDDREQLLSIEKGIHELAVRAKQRIEEEGIDEGLIWECPNCLQYTFVIDYGIDTCYTCRHQEKVGLCPHCDEPWFGWQITSFENELDWSDEEAGLYVLHNDYGYRDREACPECLPDIKEDIQRQREEEYAYWNEMAHYYSQDHTK